MGLTSSELVHLLTLVCLSQAFVLLGKPKYTDYFPPKPTPAHGCAAPSSANRNRLGSDSISGANGLSMGVETNVVSVGSGGHRKHRMAPVIDIKC